MDIYTTSEEMTGQSKNVKIVANFVEYEGKVTIRQFCGQFKKRCPKTFPRFDSRGIMWCVYASNTLMAQLLWDMTCMQHEFFSSIKVHSGTEAQGEFGEKNGLAHVQAISYGQRGRKITSVGLWKVLAPYLEPGRVDSLQVTPMKSLPGAWHYCAKPHNGCDCGDCVKARLCKPNWSSTIVCGSAPIGQGKKFAGFIEAMRETPLRSVMIEEFGGLFARYSAGMESIQEYYHTKKRLEAWRPELVRLTREQILYICDIVYNTDWRKKRQIIWIYSEAIGTGKTTIAEMIVYLWGIKNVMAGMRSLKHMINCYDDETLVHYNFPLKAPPTDEDYTLLEKLDDGGLSQAPMYKAPKKVPRLAILVTANVKPIPEWIGKGGRIKQLICLDKHIPRSKKRKFQAFQPQMIVGGY